MRIRREIWVGVSSLALAGPVVAQEAVESQNSRLADPHQLEEIVVTARRTSERLQDVPVSVTAVSTETLRQERIVNVEQVRFVAPALQITPTVNSTALPGVMLRGHRASRTLAGQDPSVGIYTNEFVQTRAAGLNTTLYDLETVEVLRGPQGTLFGRNTTGGAVLFRTRQPVDHFEGDLGLQLTEFNGVEATAVVNLPLSDQFSLRVAGNTVRRDGYVHNATTGQTVNDEDNWSGRVSLLFTPNDRWRNLTVFDHYSSDTSGALGHCVSIRPGSPVDAVTGGAAVTSCDRVAAQDLYYVESEQIAWEETTNTGVVNITDFFASDTLTLRNIFGYRDVLSVVNNDFDGTSARAIDAINTANVEWWSEEFQAVLNYPGWNAVAGLFVYRETGSEHGQAIAFRAPGSDLVNTSGGQAANTSYSAYVQGNLELDRWLSGLSLTAGLRYTVDDRQITAMDKIEQSAPVVYQACGVRDENNVALPYPDCNRTADVTYREPTYNLSLNWRFAPDNLVYVAHRRGYRSGGFNVRAKFDLDFTPFRPEIVRDIELGVKSDWRLGDMPVRTNVAAYHQWYDDIQRNVNFTQDVGGLQQITTVVFNAASAEISGLEIDATIMPIAGLTLTTAYSYIDARYNEYVNPLNNSDLSANKFADVPESTLAITGRYSLPIDPRWGDLMLGASYYRQSAIDIADVNEPPFSTIPGYDLWNFSINWNNVMGGDFSIGAFVRNAFDEEYATSGISAQSTGYTWVYAGRPRMFGLSLNRSF